MRLNTTCYTVKNTRIPRDLSGYRIGLLSDMHNCDYGCFNGDLIERVRSEAPDVLLVPGDAVMRPGGKKGLTAEYEHMIPLFAELSALCPVIFSDGNHEARLDRANKGAGYYLSFQKSLKRVGVTVLNNRSLYVKKRQLRFTGLDLPVEYYRAGISQVTPAYLEGLLGKSDRDTYNILLAHTPQFFKSYTDWGADLTVSGHVHGGIVRIPGYGGLLSPYRAFWPGYDYGRYEENGREMIVTSGLGGSSLLPRINCPPEVVIITLENGEENVNGA